jgi:CRP-like cAMP-binding protein
MTDQSDSRNFPLTHHLLAALLGVRRAGVSAVAKSLQEQGAIRYSHGKVEILDRAVLEGLACECYFLMKERSDHFLR